MRAPPPEKQHSWIKIAIRDSLKSDNITFKRIEMDLKSILLYRKPFILGLIPVKPVIRAVVRKDHDDPVGRQHTPVFVSESYV